MTVDAEGFGLLWDLYDGCNRILLIVVQMAKCQP